ncbi:MAG: 50S ribosomal protein L11 methyltransferase [Ilumatobacter sp.]
MSHSPDDHEPVLDGLNTDGLDSDRRQRMIVVRVPAALADVVSDRFWQLGVRGVSEIDMPGDDVEVVSSVGNDLDAIDRAIATFDPKWAWRIDEVPTAAGQQWRQHVRPVRYRPDMVIVPAWMADHPDIRDGDHVTLVEPGSAFGLGDHPTTTGSMGCLSDLLSGATRPPGRSVGSVLDAGCGTGVLAVRAAQHGVPRVRAIDVADAAVSATRENAALNGVGACIEVDTTPLAQIDESFDVVIANILAPVLVSLASDLVRVVAPSGTLVISGILADRHQHVLDALAPMVQRTSTTIDGWTTVVLERP